MAYATIEDVSVRIGHEMSETESEMCTYLLDDVAVMIDVFNADADENAKKLVSCRAVIRVLGEKSQADIPIGATQGSMSALGYSQSWTIGSGATGELYLSKMDKMLLGRGNLVGTWSPVQEGITEGEESHYVPPLEPPIINVIGKEEP